MIRNPMRAVGSVVVKHPAAVVGVIFALTVFWYLNIHNLRTGTDLTDLFGSNDPQWREASQIGKELGYGNQLYVLIEARDDGAESAEAMEEMASRLTSEMQSSGLFKQARSGLQEEELIRLVRYFVWNFPSMAPPGQAEEIRRRLAPRQIHSSVRRAAAELVTPFSPLGADYFVADPLGLMPLMAQNRDGLSQFAGFDLSWGSGNRFFSKDHRTLLVIAEPVQSAVDYQFAGRVVQWTRQHVEAIKSDSTLNASGLRAIPAGAYVYADEDHKFIEHNIRLISLISIVGNLILCLIVYPRIPLLLLSLLPASLGILWTTGVASFYPGELNLISLSFIAILAGLGDDQVVHFFNRIPQEWAKGVTLREAMLNTYQSTGLSIVFCILTAAIGTAALATSGFKALAEFGFILTVGMVMMMVHTLLTVPALMQLWWRVSGAKAPEKITFRLLPRVARKSVGFVGRHPRVVVGFLLALFVVSCAMLPRISLGSHFEVMGEDNAAVVAQNELAARFGIEGNPSVLLITGDQETVLARAEALTARLEELRSRGAIRSIFSPASLLPSAATQRANAAALAGVDYAAAARALEDSLAESGLEVAPHRPFIDRLRAMGDEQPVTVGAATELLPAGLLDNTIHRTGDGRYIAAIAYYSTPGAGRAFSDSTAAEWRQQYGPFIEFSFDKMSSDLQSRILHDSRKALYWTVAAIVLIIIFTFRSVRDSALVLMPIVFAIVATFGILALAGHRFSFMCITAIPLILGIGIDNGIHVVRRYRENRAGGILAVAQASGAAVILSNLTTIIGFGALMASRFAPLAELGLVTALGVGISLAGGLWLLPAVVCITEPQAVAVAEEGQAPSIG